MSLSDPTRRDFARAAAAGLAVCLAAPAAAQARREPYVDLDVPYVPTPQQVVDRMLRMAEVNGRDFVMDLGCGDGRMLVTAASRFGARGFGVDLNPARIEEATANARKAGVSDKVRFEVKNLFETSIRDADVLTMYLLPSVNLQLRPRIIDEMRPGSRIVSHAFTMAEWEPDERDRVDSRDIFFWRVPAKVAGAWTLTDGDARITLDLAQTFQMVSGAASGGASGKVQGRLKGAELRLSIAGGQSRTYAGRVDGNRISPLPGEGGAGWSAVRA